MKAWVHVHLAGGRAPLRLCWFAGTSDAALLQSLRAQLRLPEDARLLLRDADGDLVPVSAALPHDARFSLVELGGPRDFDANAPAVCAVAGEAESISSSNDSAPSVGGGAESSPARPRRAKRPRVAAADIGIGAAPLATKNQTPARVVKLFLEVFTRPIADSDNVSFIPSTGRFALYDLFCVIVTDPALHPKSQDAFYKITSLQGKVDRQRVIRYYRAPVAGADNAVEVVQYKPIGKGPLLRQYLLVDSASALAQAAQSAEPLVAILGRDPDETVARYMDFVRGFVPVPKAEYKAHRNDGYDAVEDSNTRGSVGGITETSQ